MWPTLGLQFSHGARHLDHSDSHCELMLCVGREDAGRLVGDRVVGDLMMRRPMPF